LTAHLGIILFNDQLDAKFVFCICLFQFSTCFEHSSAHHQEIQLYQYDIWYMSLYVGDRLVWRFGRNQMSYMSISILYMFRAFKCSSSGDSIVSIRHMVYVTLCRWHIHRVTHTRCRIDTIESPDDEHLNARNM